MHGGSTGWEMMSARFLPGVRVIGRALLGEKSARIKASSAAANAQLRPETMPVLLVFIAAASDEIDCAVIEAR